MHTIGSRSMDPSSRTTNTGPMEINFRAHIDRSRKFAITPGGEQRSFVPFGALKSFLTEANTGVLLRETSGSSCRIQPRKIVKSFLRVFSILLSIDKAIYLRLFYEKIHKLADANLPFTSEHDWHEKCKPFFSEFYEKQWEFCAREFDADWMNDTLLDDELILPIIQIDRLKSGTDSSTYRIQLHPEYNLLEVDTSSGLPITNDFLLKTCRRDNAGLHHNEVAAYGVLSTQDDVQSHLARYYGSWVQEDRYNMLLEFIHGGNLTNYLFNTEPPQNAEETIKFWKAFLEVVKPLARIHTFPLGETLNLQGIHHDIKLDNFLVTSPHGPSRFDVDFKLSDLGLTDIKQINKEELAAMQDRKGTQTYCCPENFVDEDIDFLLRTIQEAKPSKDIWALGCVFSQVAVWCVFGANGLLKYRQVRSGAIARINKLQSTAYSECFHNGHDVLPEVLKYHTSVCGSKRQFDQVTERILDLVREMLKSDPGDRPSAKAVVSRCHDIIEQAEDFLSMNAMVAEDAPYPTFFQIGRPSSSRPQGLGIGTTPSIGSPSNGFPTPQHPNNVRSKDFYRQEPPEQPPPDDTQSPSLAHQFHPPNPSLDAIVRTPPQSPTSTHNSSPRAQNSSLRSKEGVVTGSRARLQQRRQSLQETASRPKRNNRNSAPLPQHVDIPLEVAEKPRWTIDQVIEWIRQRKDGQTVRPLPHLDLLSKLHGRDQIFLIDDSASMIPHWDNVKRTFRALAYLVKGMDLDEMELLFTNDTGTIGSSKNTKSLISILNHAQPSGLCDIGVAFEKLLSGLDLAPGLETKRPRLPWKWRKKKGKKKYGTIIYILTDAIWQNGWREGIVDPIKTLMKKHLNKGQLGVQFVQFGSDPEGSRRLKILDRDLLEDGITKDIIDTEPWDGNVLKMLLGSIDPSWDDDQSPDSPASYDSQVNPRTYKEIKL